MNTKQTKQTGHGQCKVCLGHYWSDPSYDKPVCKNCIEKKRDKKRTLVKSELWESETKKRYYMDFHYSDGSIETLEV